MGGKWSDYRPSAERPDGDGGVKDRKMSFRPISCAYASASARLLRAAHMCSRERCIRSKRNNEIGKNTFFLLINAQLYILSPRNLALRFLIVNFATIFSCSLFLLLL